jgi:hypothetical protein
MRGFEAHAVLADTLLTDDASARAPLRRDTFPFLRPEVPLQFLSRRLGLALPSLALLACFSSSSSSSSSSSGSTNAGGCGGSWTATRSAPPVEDAPERDGAGIPPAAPEGAAPTGMSWQAVETDEGCGRSGLAWVLVDEVCGDGTRARDPRALEAPMFRDGAISGGHLFAVDATHVWSLDLGPLATGGANPIRRALLGGVGQPLAAAARGAMVALAAGEDGLVLLDAADPARPRRASSLELPGAAYDVTLDGPNAFLAMGEKGVAVADVSGALPTLVRTLAVPGLASGVAVDATHAYVAACSTFAIVDRNTGATKGKVWVPDPLRPKQLAPAKDVALVGDVAFVAAGKLGAVAIDVADPAQPKLLGSCRVEDPKFYASGVRAQGSTVFVAGGEWGVLRVDASNARTACTASTTLPAPPSSSGDVTCSTKAPWEIVPWEMVWAPPPPGKDPVQVLPDGERVFAFGDARRVGVRAVDVRPSSAPATLTARYDEPRALLAVAARGSRVVAAGAAGGGFELQSDGTFVRSATSSDDILRGASLVDLLEDGRFVAVRQNTLEVEGRATPLQLVEPASALAVAGNAGRVVVAGPSGGLRLFRVDEASGAATATYPMPKTLHLPPSMAARNGQVVVAAPEWSASATYDLSSYAIPKDLPPHAVFDDDDARDLAFWRQRVPRRYLAATPRGVVELAALGPRAAVVLHGSASKVSVSLPSVTWTGLASDGDRAYALGLDRGRYKTYVVAVDLASASPRVLSVEAFTGAGSAIALAGGRVIVADADGALRAYATGTGGLELLAVTPVGATP